MVRQIYDMQCNAAACSFLFHSYTESLFFFLFPQTVMPETIVNLLCICHDLPAVRKSKNLHLYLPMWVRSPLNWSKYDNPSGVNPSFRMPRLNFSALSYGKYSWLTLTWNEQVNKNVFFFYRKSLKRTRLSVIFHGTIASTYISILYVTKN